MKSTTFTLLSLLAVTATLIIYLYQKKSILDEINLYQHEIDRQFSAFDKETIDSLFHASSGLALKLKSGGCDSLAEYAAKQRKIGSKYFEFRGMLQEQIASKLFIEEQASSLMTILVYITAAIGVYSMIYLFFVVLKSKAPKP